MSDYKGEDYKDPFGKAETISCDYCGYTRLRNNTIAKGRMFAGDGECWTCFEKRCKKVKTETVKCRVYSTENKVVGECKIQLYHEPRPGGKGGDWYRMGPPRAFTIKAKKKFTVDHIAVTTPPSLAAMGQAEVVLPGHDRPTIDKGDTLTTNIPEHTFSLKDPNAR